MIASPTIHATAVLAGAKAALIRGPSGSGKSQLALRLIQCGALPFACLVGDDRVHLDAGNGRLLVAAAEELAGLIEVRGLGIRRLRHEPLAVVGWVIDLAASADRLPEPASRQTTIAGIALPCLALPAGVDPLPAALAFLARPASGI